MLYKQPRSYIIIFLNRLNLMVFIWHSNQSGRAVGFESYLLDIAPHDNRIIYLGIRGTFNNAKVLQKDTRDILRKIKQIKIEQMNFNVIIKRPVSW